MKSRRSLLTLLVACTFMSGTIHAIAAPLNSYDISEDRKEPPRPKPKPGPRGGDDDD